MGQPSRSFELTFGRWQLEMVSTDRGSHLFSLNSFQKAAAFSMLLLFQLFPLLMKGFLLLRAVQWLPRSLALKRAFVLLEVCG